MNRMNSLLMAVFVFIASSWTGIGEIIVQPGGSIQAAVNNATSSGDSIIVMPGVYSENIVINKPNLLIRSESGNPEDTVILAKHADSNVFYTGENNTTINGFKINPGKYSGVTGIQLTRCSNCSITNNNLSYIDIGISLSNANSNEISNNSINSSLHSGLNLLRSDLNVILNNIIYFNNHGIILENASNNNLTGNQVISNSGFGFYLSNSYSNNLNNDVLTGNNRGIYLKNSSANTMSNNNVSENYNYGILLSDSNYNTITQNIANRTGRGIHLDSSSNNTVCGNIVASNNIYGFYMCRASHRNLFYNNYANNFLNADINSTDSTWNLIKTPGRNIMGGAFIGGNYWASPLGDGFSEIAQDKDRDGIADNSYTWLTANGSNVTDYLPLAHGNGLQLQVLPINDKT